MTVTVYHKTVPNSKNQEKIDLLKYFSLGVKEAGDTVVDSYNYDYRQSTVGVIQGWVTSEPKTSPHTKLRDSVIKNQISSNNYVVAVDSNLFLYANTQNLHHYLRYSFNGVFPNTGIYCDTEINSDRWKQISLDLNISLKDYRHNGDHILLCLQRNGGWSMGSVDIQEWANNTIKKIRQYSNRPIVIRPHPGDKTTKQILNIRNSECKILFSKDVKLSTNQNILDDLKNCWAAVNYNSSPVVGAAIEGIPVFISDKEKSQCAEIANTDLSQIESPILYDRQKWVERISMFHWKFDELKSGKCWSHMRKYIS